MMPRNADYALAMKPQIFTREVQLAGCEFARFNLTPFQPQFVVTQNALDSFIAQLFAR
jgi:hypothetical protein